MIIDCESIAPLETGNTKKFMSCAPTFDLQAISDKQQPMSNEQQAMTHQLSVGMCSVLVCSLTVGTPKVGHARKCSLKFRWFVCMSGPYQDASTLLKKTIICLCNELDIDYYY